MEDVSPRAEMRKWIKARIADESTVNAPEVARELLQHFQDDDEFVAAFFEESLYPIAYRLIVETMQRTRGSANVIQLGDELVNREEVTKRSKALKNRWQSWLEHTGERHVRLLDMNRGDLLKAATIRRERAATENEIAGLWEALAQRLEGTQTVGEVFKVEDIDRVLQSLEGEAA